ncbi:hypothetical protein [Falsiroseomonas sp. E2-1-a20]|uniref:hypothetical protein n=1 Tax=Falsiroseomonas sp. E2-1-a20 TaxID=3239300 RepID=UPI003F2AED93
MDRDMLVEEVETGGVRLLPARMIGYLIYPSALELILSVPPANDRVPPGEA